MGCVIPLRGECTYIFEVLGDGDDLPSGRILKLFGTQPRSSESFKLGGKSFVDRLFLGGGGQLFLEGGQLI